MNSLCRLYHVGIRTVKDVLKRLREEGYIYTEERKAAVVTYRQTDPEHKNMAVRSALERKKSILEVYQTLGVIMPLIFSFSVQLCSDEELSQWSKLLARAKGKEAHVRWEACSAFLYETLDKSHNLLFRDLFVSLEVYARLSVFQDQKRYHELVREYNEFGDVIGVMEVLLTKKTNEINNRFGCMYRSVTRALRVYLDEMSEEYGEVPENASLAYSWVSERGRDHYYTQIARDLIDKIGMGKYREGEFLPPEAELARRYGVSVFTIRNAIGMLNELGFGQTFNAKGTQVIIPDNKAAFQCLKNKTYKKDTLMYLSGIQLMAVIIRPAAILAFHNMKEQDKLELKENIQGFDAAPLDLLVQCVIDYVPLQPLKTILCEVNKLLYWGYYFQFYSKGPGSANLLYRKSMDAFTHLWKGDAEEAARLLSECYSYILTFVRKFLVSCGFPEASEMIPPEAGEDLILPNLTLP